MVKKEDTLEATYLLLKRLGVIAGFATLLAIAHLVLHFQAKEIARSVMSQYIPMTASELDSATRSKGYCRDEYTFISDASCTPDKKSWEGQKVQTAYYHQRQWEENNLYQGEARVQVAVAILFGIGYSILLVLMFNSLREFFKAGPAATIHKRFTNLKRTAIDSSGGLREAMDRRQLHQAQKELLSLKSLYENGVISEEVFVKRKAVLAARLAHTSR